MELVKIKFYGIGVENDRYILDNLLLVLDSKSYYEKELKELNSDLNHGQISKENFNKKYNQYKSKINLSDSDVLFNFRAAEILALIYLEPPYGHQKNYSLGIKHGEKLIEKYLKAKADKVSEEYCGQSCSIYQDDLEITADTKKIFFILADIYSGKVEKLFHLIDIEKAIKYYNIASEMGYINAHLESKILVNYKNSQK